MKLRIFFCYGGYKVQEKSWSFFFASRKEYTKVIYQKVIACILIKIMLPYKCVLSFNFKKGIIIKLLL